MERKGKRKVVEGDRNTRYFQSMANFRRKKHYIEELNINNQSIKGNLDMRDCAKRHFQKLYEDRG